VDPILVASSGILTGYHKKDLKPPLKIIRAIKEHAGPVRIGSIQPVNLRPYRLTPLGDWIFVQNKIGRAGGYEPLAMLHTLQFLTHNWMERFRFQRRCGRFVYLILPGPISMTLPGLPI